VHLVGWKFTHVAVCLSERSTYTVCVNAGGIFVDKSLGAAFPVCGKIGGKSMFFPLTEEFVFNLKYKIHAI
jgi:hypothetical protein